MRIIAVLLIFFSFLYSKHTTVNLRLSWLHQFQFAGFYIAKEKGFYAKKGLKVNLHQYNKNFNPIEEVQSQKMQFSVGKSSLIIEKAKGAKIVALGALFQEAPSVLITTNPNIKRLEDLKGKRIMMTSNEANAIGVKAMLGSKDIHSKDFIRQEQSFNIYDLIEGKTDAMASYISNEPFLLKKIGVDFTMFSPKDYGLDMYGDILYTSEELTKRNPILVRNFYEATIQGWKYAFEHIEETAKIIHKKYNTQGKSLEHLIFEGETLKSLAFDKNGRFGVLSKRRLNDIVKIYKLFDVLPRNFFLKGFLDPLGLGKEPIYIGVLAKRGKTTTIKRWQATAKHLNQAIPNYHFRINPLRFDSIDSAIKSKEIDFLLANTLIYVQMAHKYGISRIATLLNNGKGKIPYLEKFGSVIIAKKTNHNIGSIADLKGKSFGAVHPNSFGGWIMAQELLHENGIDKEDLDLYYFGTHDNVVYSVLSGKAQAGSVRTTTLERMAKEGKINLSNLKIVSRRFYKDFPYLISTKTYPEWPFAKLKHTSQDLSKEVLAVLLNLSPHDEATQEANIFGWTIPLDYSNVHQLLNNLRIYPYEIKKLSLKEILFTYKWWFIASTLFLIALLLVLIYIKRINRHLAAFNQLLEVKIKERTQELKKSNKQLQLLAHTDELTNITNRRFFLQRAEEYLLLSQRNDTPLSYLSLDIDHFKRINDEYGHQTGDIALQSFTKVVHKNLRKIDLFGRIGGEEFAICLQNTDIKGAKVIAEKIRQAVQENIFKTDDGKEAYLTVSIGAVEYNKKETLNKLMQKADKALYRAKDSGRNRVFLSEDI